MAAKLVDAGGYGSVGDDEIRDYRYESNPRSQERDDACFDFRDTGSCRYGDECRFRHGADDSRDLALLRRPRRPKKSNGVCYAFRETGECEYGDRCRFSHIDGGSSGASPRGASPRRGTRGGPRKDNICYTFRDTGDCQYGDRCRFKHVKFGGDSPSDGGRGNLNRQPKYGDYGADRYAADAADYDEYDGGNDQICYQFQKSGRCRFGDGCRFEHIYDGNRSYSSSNPATPNGEASNLCFEFRDIGSCKYGDACRFKHGLDDDRKRFEKKSNVCYEFRDNGDCKWGDKCRFDHDQN